MIPLQLFLVLLNPLFDLVEYMFYLYIVYIYIYIRVKQYLFLRCRKSRYRRSYSCKMYKITESSSYIGVGL